MRPEAARRQEDLRPCCATAHSTLGTGRTRRGWSRFGGWEMPLEFQQGTLAEHMACRRHAAIFDVSHLGTVRLVGAGSEAVLQHALTNDLAKITPGQAPVQPFAG